MADDKKKKYQPTSYSPKGRAVFPRLNEPDTKFKAGGAYSTKIRLPEAEARAFLAKFDALAEENFKEASEEHNGEVDKKTGKPLPDVGNSGVPFALEFDKDTKEPTGFILIPFSCNATYKDKKTNTEKTFKPAIYDSMARATSAKVGGGSLIKVAFTPFGYYNPAERKAGITFRLQAVQVIELKQGGADVEFGVEEGGWTADDQGFQNEAQPQAEAAGVPPTRKGNF